MEFSCNYCHKCPASKVNKRFVHPIFALDIRGQQTVLCLQMYKKRILSRFALPTISETRFPIKHFPTLSKLITIPHYLARTTRKTRTNTEFTQLTIHTHFEKYSQDSYARPNSYNYQHRLRRAKWRACERASNAHVNSLLSSRSDWSSPERLTYRCRLPAATKESRTRPMSTVSDLRQRIVYLALPEFLIRNGYVCHNWLLFWGVGGTWAGRRTMWLHRKLKELSNSVTTLELSRRDRSSDTSWMPGVKWIEL